MQSLAMRGCMRPACEGDQPDGTPNLRNQNSLAEVMQFIETRDTLQA